MTARVELIYQDSCPNVEEARAALRAALIRTRHRPRRWTEWERGAADAPEHARRYGSPTVLVDGRDVMGVAPGDGSESCRVYRGGRGVPPVDAIVAALAAGGVPASRWSRILAVVPGTGLALLPIGACPACWPAYAGLLGSLGLGFLLESSYLLPLTGVFLGLALIALGYRAKERRGYGPLALGAGAAALTLLGKFALASSAALYSGLALLIGASIWNAWPPGAALPGTCGRCASQGSGPNEPGASEKST